MNKITGFYNQNVNFSGVKKEEKVLSNEEKFEKLYDTCKGILISNLEKDNFEPIPFEISGTPYIAVFKVQNSKDEKRFTLGVRHKDRDRLVSYNMFKGSKQDMIEYLKNNDTEIKEAIQELKKDQEEYYSSL